MNGDSATLPQVHGLRSWLVLHVYEENHKTESFSGFVFALGSEDVVLYQGFPPAALTDRCFYHGPVLSGGRGRKRESLSMSFFLSLFLSQVGWSAHLHTVRTGQTRYPGISTQHLEYRSNNKKLTESGSDHSRCEDRNQNKGLSVPTAPGWKHDGSPTVPFAKRQLKKKPGIQSPDKLLYRVQKPPGF